MSYNNFLYNLSNFLCRYAAEVDVDFVRKAVRAIGRLAVKIETASDKCITTLLELIQTKVNYVVQEAIIVIRVRQKKKKKKEEHWVDIFCCNRTFLENIPTNMKASFLHCVRTWMILMSQKQRLP